MNCSQLGGSDKILNSINSMWYLVISTLCTMVTYVLYYITAKIKKKLGNNNNNTKTTKEK